MAKALDRLIRLLEETGGVLALAVMFVAIVVQVIFRYLFTPLVWPFELSIYMYICLVYLGAALAARHDSHVAFDVLFKALPVRTQQVLSAGLRVFGAAVLATLIVPGIQFMRQSHTMRSASLYIPWSFLVLVYLTSVILMISHLVAGAVRDWRRTRTGES
ncbi:MAG: TRAP transporter small permease subunit [candidate division NC10 bacterium]|nr:TRAP transporter small permease subunit [candidate division NC10 bacterium]MBI4842269.1 TRAP transporter small permease subunit [candidate division NC10 bacterium]